MQKRHHQILGVLSGERAEELLMDWANMPGPWPLNLGNDQASLQKKFADAARKIQRRYRDIFGDSHVLGHLQLRDFLRRAWDSSDLREREWYVFKFRDQYQLMARRFEMTITEVKAEEAEEVNVAAPRYAPPPITPVEAAAFYLQKNLRLALHCPNPGCPAPYFFASRKGQKFCSPECAIPSQRESKLRWWNENRAGGKRKRRK